MCHYWANFAICTYLSYIYGHLAECKGGVELKELTQQML